MKHLVVLLILLTVDVTFCRYTRTENGVLFALIIKRDVEFKQQLNLLPNQNSETEEAKLRELIKRESDCYSGVKIIKFYELPNNLPGSAYVAKFTFNCKQTLNELKYGLRGINVVSISDNDFGISSNTDADTVAELIIDAEESCFNGGFFIPFNTSTFECNCPDFYDNAVCSQPVCLNGGFSITEKNCQCPPGYVGIHCETAQCQPASKDSFSSTLSFNLVLHNRFEIFGLDVYRTVFQQAFRSLSLNSYTLLTLTLFCDNPGLPPEPCFGYKTNSAADFKNTIIMDPFIPLASTNSCFTGPVFANIMTLLATTATSRSPIFFITQHPPSDAAELEERVIKRATAWNARIFIFYITPQAFNCSLNDFEPLVRLTKATNGQFIVITSRSPPNEMIFSSIMDTQYNSQILNAAITDDCSSLSLDVNEHQSIHPIYVAVATTNGTVNLTSNRIGQNPLVKLDENWYFYNLSAATKEIGIIGQRTQCNVIVYTESLSTVFSSFSNDESIDTYVPYLIEGVPLSVTVHSQLDSSITEAVTSVGISQITSNGSLSRTSARSRDDQNCAYEWIANMQACDLGGTTVIQRIDLQLRNGENITRVFAVYCNSATMLSTSPSPSTTTPMLTTSSSSVETPSQDPCNTASPTTSTPTTTTTSTTTTTTTTTTTSTTPPILVTCEKPNQLPGALDNSFRSFTFLIEVTSSTTDIIDQIIRIVRPIQLFSASVVWRYNLIFFGTSCLQSIIVTPSIGDLLLALNSSRIATAACGTNIRSATLQDAIVLAANFFGQDKGLVYAVLSSNRQLQMTSGIYPILQAFNITIYIAALTPIPIDVGNLQTYASATGGALFVFDSTQNELSKHLKNVLPLLLAKPATLGLYTMVPNGNHTTPFSIESSYSEDTKLIVTYIDPSGGNGTVDISYFGLINGSYWEVFAKDKYTTVLHFNPPNATKAFDAVAITTNCINGNIMGCTLIVQVFGGQQATVRFTDQINSDFPTARPVTGQSIIPIVYLPDAMADYGIHMLNLTAGNIEQGTVVNFRNRTNCTFSYAGTLTPGAGANWLVITGEEPSRRTFKKFIPFIIVDQLHCYNGGTTLGSNTCQCPVSQYPPGKPVWSHPDCSQVVCHNDGKPNTQKTACICPEFSNGFTGRFCDKPVTSMASSSTMSSSLSTSALPSTSHTANPCTTTAMETTAITSTPSATTMETAAATSLQSSTRTETTAAASLPPSTAMKTTSTPTLSQTTAAITTKTTAAITTKTTAAITTKTTASKTTGTTAAITSATTTTATTTTTTVPSRATSTTTTAGGGAAASSNESSSGLPTGVILAIAVTGGIILVGAIIAVAVTLVVSAGGVGSGMALGSSAANAGRSMNVDRSGRRGRIRPRLRRSPPPPPPTRLDTFAFASAGNVQQASPWPWQGASGLQY